MAEALEQSSFQALPWIPFQLPTAEGTTLHALVKAHFSQNEYAILVTDLKRVWRETATEDKIQRKLKTYAKSFSETPTDKMLPFIKGYVENQKPNVRYMTFFEPDETGELKIHATGTVGTITFRWVFECTQLHTEVLRPTPGDVLCTQVSLPLLMIATEQQRRIEVLEALLEKKEKEIQECHDNLAYHGAKFIPRRSEPFSRETFAKKADGEFKLSITAPESLPKAFFENPEDIQMYTIAMHKLDPTAQVDGDRMDGMADRGPSPPVALSKAPTLPTGQLASAGMFATVDPSMGSEITASQALSKKEAEKALELQRRQEREERLARLQEEEKVKKKKRKII